MNTLNTFDNTYERADETENSGLKGLLAKLHLQEWEELYEITYAYKNIKPGVVNTSIFVRLGGLGDEITTESLKKSYKQANSALCTALEQITSFLSANNGLEAFYVRALEYYKDLIAYTLCAMPFEAKKTKLVDDVFLSSFYASGRNETDAIQKLREIDKKLFGPEVKDCPDESEYCIQFLLSEYRSVCKRNHLSVDELSAYKNYLIAIGCESEQLVNNEENGTPKKKKDTKDGANESKLLDKVKGTMTREKYMEVFILFLTACGIDGKKVEINDDISSVFDAKDSLQIPGGPDYEEKPKARVLKMMIHEIETHFFSEMNHDKKWSMRGGGHLGREEGHAQGLELLFAGKHLDEIGYTVSLPTILAGEMFTGEKFLEYLSLRQRGLNLKDDSKSLYLRRKRGYPDV